MTQIDDLIRAYQRGDYETAYRLSKPLAEQGFAQAQFIIAAIYANGYRVPKDYTEAVKWCRKAAEQGHASAQFNLGISYDMGIGVPQNHAEAVKWWRLAAEQGRADAQYRLGNKFQEGRGVPQNYSEAAMWFQKAAEQGHAIAQLDIGFMYGFHHGLGVALDYVLAYMWLTLAISRADEFKEKVRILAVEARHLVSANMTPAQIAEAQHLACEWELKKKAH